MPNLASSTSRTFQLNQCACCCPSVYCVTLEINENDIDQCGCDTACVELLWNPNSRSCAGTLICGTISISLEFYLKTVDDVDYLCLRSACLGYPLDNELCVVLPKGYGYPDQSSCPGMTLTLTAEQLQNCGGNQYCNGGTLRARCIHRINPGCRNFPACICQAQIVIDLNSKIDCGCDSVAANLAYDSITGHWTGTVGNCGTSGLSIDVEVWFAIENGLQYQYLRSNCLGYPEGYELRELRCGPDFCPTFIIPITSSISLACGGNDRCTGALLIGCFNRPQCICKASIEIDKPAIAGCECDKACIEIIYDPFLDAWKGTLVCDTIQIDLMVWFSFENGVLYKYLRSLCLGYPAGQELVKQVCDADSCPFFELKLTASQLQNCGGNGYCSGGTLRIGCQQCAWCACDCLCMTFIEGAYVASKSVCWNGSGWGAQFKSCMQYPVDVNLTMEVNDYTHDCILKLDAPGIGIHNVDVTPFLHCPKIDFMYFAEGSNGERGISVECQTCDCECAPCFCPSEDEVCVLYATVTAEGCNKPECPTFTATFPLYWHTEQKVWLGMADPPPSCPQDGINRLELQLRCTSINGKPTPLLHVTYNQYLEQDLLPSARKRCDPVLINFTSLPFYACDCTQPPLGDPICDYRILKISITE